MVDYEGSFLFEKWAFFRDGLEVYWPIKVNDQDNKFC